MLKLAPLPIGHAFRPSAFSRKISSKNCVEDKILKFQISLKEANEEQNVRHIEDPKENDVIRIISSANSKSPKLKTTPSFWPLNSDVLKPIETKEEIIAEFMDSLEAPSTKVRTPKPLLEMNNSMTWRDFKAGFFGCQAGKYDIEIGTNPSEIDISPSQMNRFPQECRPKIGYFTYEERKVKILKYKSKIQKWLKGEHKNKNLYYKRRSIARNKKRIHGKFIRQNL